jgi:glycosyltransferase involved in cell wall biosynthesis
LETVDAPREAFTPQNYPLRVAYDATAFLPANGGTGKGIQLRNILGAYSKCFLGFATRGKNHSDQRLIQAGLSSYQFWQQLSLPRLLQKYQADFFLAPYNIAPLFIPEQTKLILVLHDLILLQRFHMSSLRQRMNSEFRRFLVPRAVSRAHVVLTVSEYSKQQIEKRFPSAQVQVIPCSIPPSWFVEEHHQQLDERENYILAVTSSAPHKNALRTLAAYATFVARADRATVPRLRIVGLSDSAQQFRGRANDLHIQDLVDIEPYLTEDELQKMYRRSRAVLVPSLMEGFGIPVLEAMASGTPVIAADATSLPEVGGTAAAYFDPTNTADFANVLEQVLSDAARQWQMVQLGFIQARQFHPKVVGGQVQTFWDNLARNFSNSASTRSRLGEREAVATNA